MTRAEFEKIVEKAMAELPQEFLDRLHNVEIAVEDWPTARRWPHRRGPFSQLLLGSYRGIPLPRRGVRRYGNVMPDKIVIYQRAIESVATTREELERKVSEVVWHEIGHYFGLSEEELANV
jgi:predicted Zn-dependent protease with MMP-like domain